MEAACEYGLTRGTCFVARGGRGHRAAVDLFRGVFLEWDFVGGGSRFFALNALGLLQI